ncbi:MAG: ribosome-binding factor A [bacterium]|nr:ribosome-binding factor A [bacterium]
MSANRMDQINELLRSELALQISRSVELPDGSVVSITKVRTSPDLRHASVFVTIMPDKLSGTILKTLKKELFNIGQEIAPKLSLRNFPRLQVKIDETERSAAHIENLLDKIKENQ